MAGTFCGTLQAVGCWIWRCDWAHTGGRSAPARPTGRRPNGRINGSGLLTAPRLQPSEAWCSPEDKLLGMRGKAAHARACPSQCGRCAIGWCLDHDHPPPPRRLHHRQFRPAIGISRWGCRDQSDNLKIPNCAVLFPAIFVSTRWARRLDPTGHRDGMTPRNPRRPDTPRAATPDGVVVCAVLDVHPARVAPTYHD